MHVKLKLDTVLDADRPPEELSHFPGFLMNFLGRKSGARFAALLEPYGIHPREFGAMTVITRRPGLTQQELAAIARVDPSSMVALLDELEAGGLAERRRHEADRRKYAIHPTDKGRRTMQRLQAEARAAGEAFLAPLDDDERAQLLRLLRKLAGFED